MDTGITQPPFGERIKSDQAGNCSEHETHYSFCNISKNRARKNYAILTLVFWIFCPSKSSTLLGWEYSHAKTRLYQFRYN